MGSTTMGLCGVFGSGISIYNSSTVGGRSPSNGYGTSLLMESFDFDLTRGGLGGMTLVGLCFFFRRSLPISPGLWLAWSTSETMCSPVTSSRIGLLELLISRLADFFLEKFRLRSFSEIPVILSESLPGLPRSYSPSKTFSYLLG
jgi:hypothetical protein